MSSDPRPSSVPYISGDTFRKIANHLYDETKKCKADNIREKDTVFVNTDFLDEWFTDIHPQISNPYKLITHNSDKNITNDDLRKYLDGANGDRIIHWFAQNVCVEDGLLHPKLTPLPIGLENAHYTNAGRTALFSNKFEKVKQSKIFVNFNVNTNTRERNECLEIMQKIAETHPNFIHIVSNRISQQEYAELTTTYQFIISPPGNGNDTHRTWEAMYRGCVPIVKHSAGMEYFASLGLPMIVVDDWYNVEKIEVFKYVGNSGHEALHFNYWENIIKNQE